MASPSLKLLVQIQSDLSQLNAAIQGLAKLQQQAQATAQAGFTMADAFKFAGAEEALRRVIDGVTEAGKKMVEITVDFMRQSIEKAAEIQTEQFPLTQMLRDSGVVAKEVLEGIHSLWQQIGVVSNESLGKAAQSLLLIGTPAENLIPRLTELSKISVGTGVALEDMASAYQRLRQAIVNETEPMIRGMGGFGKATQAMVQTLSDNLGVTVPQVMQRFKSGQITFDDLNQALRSSAEEGGRFADVFAEKQATFDGAVTAMKTAWQGFQAEIGKPIIDFLTPIINRITVFERRLAEIAQESGWKVAIEAAWEVVLNEMADSVPRILLPAFARIGEKLADVMAAEFFKFLFGKLANLAPKVAEQIFGPEVAETLRKLAGTDWDAFLDGLVTTATTSPETARAKVKLQEILHGIFGSGDWVKDTADKIWFDFLATFQGGPTIQIPFEVTEETDRANATKLLGAAMHELETAMAGVHQQQNLINAQPFIGADEKQRQLLANYNQEIAALQSGISKLQSIISSGVLNVPQLAEATGQIVKAQNQIDILKQKITGLTQPLRTELTQWANSFGSTAQQIGRTIEQTIGTSLQALNQYLVTGKFNAQQLLQQIITLGLQLVEQMIIQRVMAAINQSVAVTQAAASGKAIALSYAGAATAVNVATEGAAALQAPITFAAALSSIIGQLGVAHEGGPVGRLMTRFHGGGLAADEVPIIAQQGEIMIQRSVAQQPGMAEFLLGLNEGMFHTGGYVAGRRYHEGTEPGSFGRLEEFGWAPPWYDPGDLGFGTSPGDWGEPSTTATGGSRGGVFREFAQPAISPWWSPGRWGGFGYQPSQGWSPFGGTVLPTNWVNYPGVGYVPMAVPVSQAPWGGYGTPETMEQHHGGVIRKHAGGTIRMHSGGSVPGRMGASAVNIYAFTDLRALTKHMASQDGQKIIFDTIKGRRIDLGIK